MQGAHQEALVAIGTGELTDNDLALMRRGIGTTYNHAEGYGAIYHVADDGDLAEQLEAFEEMGYSTVFQGLYTQAYDADGGYVWLLFDGAIDA